MADGQVPAQRAEGGLVEDLGDQTHVLEDHDLGAVADRDPGGLLAAVLQGVEAEVAELGHLLARGPDPEHATGVLRAAVVGVEVVVQATICASSRRRACGDTSRRRARWVWHCLMLSRRRHGSRPDGAVPRSRAERVTAIRVVAMSTRSEKPSPSSGSSSWRRRLRRLQTELGDFAVRNLINLGAVVAVGLLIAADSPTVRALGALAGLASLIGILVRRWSDFYPKPKTGLLGYFVSVRLLLVVGVGGIYLHSRPDAGTGRGGRRLGRRRDLVAAGDGRAPGQDAAGHHQDRRPQPARRAAGAEGAVLPRLDRGRQRAGHRRRGRAGRRRRPGLDPAGAGPGHRAADPAHGPPRAAGDRCEQADRAGHPGRAAGVRAGLRRLLRRQSRAPGTSSACGCRTWSGSTSRTW